MLSAIALFTVFLFPLVVTGNPNWIKTKRANADNEFIFRIDLIHKNLDQLEARFWATSNPKHSMFRKYLSSDEISDMISPSLDQFNQVINWLHCSRLLPFSELKMNNNMKSSEKRNIPDREILCYQSIHKDFIYIKSTVRMIETFFNLELSEYHFHATNENDMILIRTEDPISLVPSHLQSIISRVYGIKELPPIDALFASASGTHRGKHQRINEHKDLAIQAREPGDQITPFVIWKTYGLDTILPLNSSLLLGNMSCAEFQDEEFLPSDVTKFESMFGLPEIEVDIIGANNGGYFGEGSLDTEYLTGTAPGLGVTWIGVPWGSSFVSGSLYIHISIYVRYLQSIYYILFVNHLKLCIN